MRLICVPLWLSNTLTKQGMSAKSLLKPEELCRVISKDDLSCYTQSCNELGVYLNDTFKNLDLDRLLCSPFMDNPSPCFIDFMVKYKENPHFESIENVLVGRVIPPNHFISLKVQVLPESDDSEATAGIFVCLQEGSFEDKKKANADFLDQLLEVLYAHHNGCLTDLARSGLIGAFVNNLGQDI